MKTQEFKDFFSRSKREEYIKIIEQENARVPTEQFEEVTKKVLTEMNFNAMNITLEEGRKIVRASVIILLLEWDISPIIDFATIRRKDEVFSS